MLMGMDDVVGDMSIVLSSAELVVMWNIRE